jgi:CheY-like chemotaxis protein
MDVDKGTGLGLSTVFGIVHQHKGWVEVSSEIAKGTTFRVYLPRLTGSTGLMPSEPELPPSQRGNETILLVEDDPSVRVSVQTALSGLGYRVICVPSGEEALEVLRERRNEIRLLLTDLIMPNGTAGTDLAERALEDSPKVGVIYMSRYSRQMMHSHPPMKEGFTYITKPFRVEKLARVVRNCLDRLGQTS